MSREIYPLFEQITSDDPSIRRLIVGSANGLIRSGFIFLEEVREKSIKEVIGSRNIGPKKAAVIFVICQHYGINITLNESSSKIKLQFDETLRRISGNLIFPD